MEVVDVSGNPDFCDDDDDGEGLIRIEDRGYAQDRTTKAWRVFNARYNQAIGWIRWHDARRRYCFVSEDATYYDRDTMRLISEFLDAQMQIRVVARGP